MGAAGRRQSLIASPTPEEKMMPSSVAELQSAALQHHRSGRLAEAEALYGRILDFEPRHADALHLLGVIAHQTGRTEIAIGLMRRAVAAQPKMWLYLSNLGATLRDAGQLAEAESRLREALRLKRDFPHAHNSLGNVLRDRDRLDEAEACYRAALRLDPGYTEAHFNLGCALLGLGLFDEAEACYRKALRLAPTLAEAYHGLGAVLQSLGRFGEAETAYRGVIHLKPDSPEAHCNLGNVLVNLGRMDEAEGFYRVALRLRPDYADAYNGLGTVFGKLGRWAEAEACYRDAIGQSPDFFGAYSNLGDVLRNLGRFHEAERCCREALRLEPKNTAAHTNLANALQNLCRLEEAENHYREALRLEPGDAVAHANLGMLLLLAGRFEMGWEEYEWRWRAEALPPRGFEQPQWRGEKIGGRTLLLHADQGFGDTIQFCRYVPLVAAKADVVLEVPRALVRLFSGLENVARIIPHGEALPPFDLHCPLFSLPRVFGTTLDTIPGATPYLGTNPDRVALWRERLRELGGLRVGLVWSGNPRRGKPAFDAADRRRSIGLASLAALSGIEAVRFVSLQKGEAAGQAKTPPPGMAIHDWTDELDDFADTAALIAALDLVIGVDTAVIHLAGALGKPVWMLNRFDTDWRWLLDRGDSPWYPSMRIFRQPAPGDWDGVLGEARRALTALAGRESPDRDRRIQP
jgi:tetratricopeptide (TPR) repeat protein